MSHSPVPPLPSDLDAAGSGNMISPGTGAPLRVADLRDEFARMSRETPRDPAAEQAFIAARLEMIANDPHMSDEEKKAARDALLGGDKRLESS